MENTGRTSSCLAISEKKTHKPGGCVGIFFQLFDWNRRLAKKKLFSRKLLPPAKQATKKFKGGEKMPVLKNHLIADENRGGFPNVKKNGNRCTDIEQRNEMRVPGLVARLMGLESMPALNRERPKKTGFSNPCDNVEKKTVEEVNLEKACAKVEARPLKLQKTGPEERKVIRRIGAEVLQYKSVLSRSRKHTPPKFPSSAKSPRLTSGKNVSRASRLIDVASKILEPGLQASNRAKSAITLPKSMHYSPNDVVPREIGVVSLEGYDSSKSFMGQASCKNCNNLMKVGVFNNKIVEEYPSPIPPHDSTYPNASLQGLEWSNMISPELRLEQESDEVLQTNCDQPKSFSSKHNESKGCITSQVESIAEKLPLNNESPSPLSRPSGQQFKLRTNEPSVIKHRSQPEVRMTSSREGVSSKSKSIILQSRRTTTASANAAGETKNFVALNRSLNGCNGGRLPAKVENSKLGIGRKSFNGGQDVSLQSGTSPRKRRTAHLSAQIESKDSVISPATKQRSPQSDKFPRTSSRSDQKSLPSKPPCAANRLAGRREAGDRVCRRDNDTVSVICDSPIRNGRTMPYQKPSLFEEEAIDILEQKLKELTSRGDDESGSPLKKPASVIIQELISALEAARKVSLEGSNMDVTFCGDANEELPARTPKGRDHLSPGSVLEASFSSSSLDESSGCMMLAESVDCSIDQSQLSEPDADLLDSATSLSERNSGNERVTEVLDAISTILQSCNLSGIRLTGSKLAHAREVMLNTELTFGQDKNNLLIMPLFTDELETFTCEMLTNSSNTSYSEDSKEVNQLREFLFDCLIECLDSKHSQVYSGGCNAWIRTSPVPNARAVIEDAEKKMKKWGDFAGMMTDDMIEWEMSHSLGKWSDFSIEELENVAEIGVEILQILVDEIVTELWG